MRAQRVSELRFNQIAMACNIIIFEANPSHQTIDNLCTNLDIFALDMIRGKKTLVMMGVEGGSKCFPPKFLSVKTIEKVIRLCTVLNFFFER